MRSPVPKSITVNTGGEHEVAPIIDQFMAETASFVTMALRARIEDFRIESGEVSDGPNHISNDRVTFLKYKSQVIALVMETRTEFNFVRYDFFRNLKGLGKRR